MCADAPDLEQCAEPGCTNMTELRCQVPLRGRLAGTTCGRASCRTHGSERDGGWCCASHARIAAKESTH